MEKLLERMTGLVAAITLLVVALSVCHEFGYFWRIGGGFFQTFLTASDYFTNSVVWVPPAIFTVIGWWNWGSLVKDPTVPTLRQWKTWIVPALITALPIMSMIIFREPLPVLWLIAFVYYWALLFEIFVPVASPTIAYAYELRQFVKLAGPVCAGMVTLGYIDASNNLSGASDPYMLQIAGSKATILRYPVRNFDKGMLVRDPIEQRLEFLKWDDIESIKHSVSMNNSEPASCRWFGFGFSCGSPVMNP
jgi:hypothetical protein